jgi:hypothetical protein
MGAKPVVTKSKEHELLDTPLLVKGSESLRSMVAKLLELDQVLDGLLALAQARREQMVNEFASITLLTREQAAERLSMSLTKLDRVTKKKSLPRIMLDRRVRYSVKDLEIYVDSRRVDGRGTPAQPAPRQRLPQK